MDKNSESRPATLSSSEESSGQASMVNNEVNESDSEVAELNISSTPQAQGSLEIPTQLRDTLAAIGLACSLDGEFFGTSAKIFYGRGESTGVLWPIPLIGVSEISDPDEDGCGDETGLNGLLPRGIAYRSGPTTEMISRRWHQTPVTIRRMRDNQPPDVLLDELKNLSQLRHPGLIMLMAVSATESWDSVQLVYEPIYHGSLHHRLHIMGSSIPLIERLLVLQQICDALLFLHSQKLLHCSVSSHAVHLVSTGRAKLGCLETMTEDNSLSKRAYREVPSSHWECMAPWLAPECARGEFASTLSDVYSFCCLVWETCSEKIPWSHLDSKEINRMWQKESCNNRTMLPLGPDIPLHVTSFLKLGLQPESSERCGMDLQEFYLMIRIQAATKSRSQQKELDQKSSPPPVGINSPTPVPPTFTHSQIQPQHGLDEAVEENFKEKRIPSRSNEKIQTEVELECNGHLQQTASRTRNPSGGVRIAIKPASHSTERNANNCQMSHPDRNTSTLHEPPPIEAVSRRKRNAYSGLTNEIYEAASEAAKIFRQSAEFETLRPKMDEANEDENAAEESTVEVSGHPSLTSTQRHQHGVSYLACSSGLEDPEIGCRSDDIGGAKPKRSRVRIDSPTPVPPTFTHSQIQPQHGWDAVKENFKKRRTLSPPPPPPPGQQPILEVLSDSSEDCNGGNGRSNSRVDNAGGGQNTDRIDGDCESSDFVAVSADGEASNDDEFYTPPK